MSRPLRIDYPNAWYHVMSRGRRAEEIFLDNLDYKAFGELLQETSVVRDQGVEGFQKNYS